MKNIFTIFVALFVGATSFSQVKKKDTTETSSKIRVFTPSSSYKSKADNSYKWSVKTDLFSILTGEFPIIGEYRIGSKFSVEASAGLTYGYISNHDLNILNDDEDDNYVNSDNPEMGSAFRVAFKYFPSSDYDAIEGWYFGVQLMNKTTNRSYEKSSYEIDDNDTKVKTGASIIIGKQVFQDSNVVWDFYFGVGLASTKHTFYNYNYDYDTGIETINRNEETKSKPNILLGLRIGFGN
ncbi:MAG: DUF3575 domain-containing protein [Flavobacterium sp.]|nr:MAG: DUF3575 domain-containing protein [Flavobacterium sp.]